MATDRDLQNILSSGNITAMQIGGITADEKVLTQIEHTAAITSFDKTLTSLVAITVQAALEELANIGYGHMILATPYTGGQTVGTTPIKISTFDTIHHDVNGAVTPIVDISEAVPAHKFTADKTGTYRIYGTIEAEFASSDAVSLILYKNGVEFGRRVTVQGRGAGKPVLFSYIDLASLTATDYLEIYALSDAASTSVLITGSSMVVERMAI